MKIDKPGIYSFNYFVKNPDSATQSVIYVSGSGTATLKFIDESNTAIELEDGNLTLPGTKIVNHGLNPPIVVDIQGVSESSPMYMKWCKLQ